MLNKINLLGNGIGKIVYNSNNLENIIDLPVVEVIKIFKSSGVLLFRNFKVTPQQMKSFSEKMSFRHFIDHTKDSIHSDVFINFVDNGMNSRVPHCEHAYSPFRPQVIWFCCTVPAAEGGETLFWDGVRVWEELSQETKQLFISKKLKFCHKNIPIDMLKVFAGISATFDDVKQMLDSLEGVTYQINENNTISIEYVCSAVVKTKYGHQDAFANSFWVKQKKTEEATFEDGSRASNEVTNEIQKVLDRLTEEIPWQAGDLAMIDNSRFLHGRREFNDNRREIFTTLSNLHA